MRQERDQVTRIDLARDIADDDEAFRIETARKCFWWSVRAGIPPAAKWRRALIIDGGKDTQAP